MIVTTKASTVPRPQPDESRSHCHIPLLQDPLCKYPLPYPHERKKDSSELSHLLWSDTQLTWTALLKTATNLHLTSIRIINLKGGGSPCTGLDRRRGVQEVEARRIFNRHIKVVRLTALGTERLYPQGRSLVLISARDWVDSRAIVRPEGLSQRKSQSPSGIELATFWVVAQCLNQLRYRVPRIIKFALRKVLKTNSSWWKSFIRFVLI